MTADNLAATLRQMLAMLAHAPTLDGEWEGWRIGPILGGGNNRLSRATNEQHDLAIKWTIHDWRRRARREFAALRVLEAEGLSVAPRAVLLDEDQPQPVVVQTWLDGEVSKAPPSNDAEWNRLLEHFATIHSIGATTTTPPLERAVLTATDPDDCRAVIEEQLALLPPERRSGDMLALIRRFDATLARPWTAVPMALCRVDSNTSNFVRRAGAWASVDWENSGWGDPTFEIAELITHPAYGTVEPERWSWVIEHYGALRNDAGAAERIELYRRTMLVWWVVRFARYGYDIERGADGRLVERPAAWRETLQQQYDNAIVRAHRAFDE